MREKGLEAIEVYVREKEREGEKCKKGTKGVNDVEGMRTRLREGKKGPSEGKKW